MVLVRITVVAESFLPQTNGVVNTVVRALEHFESRGDDVLVIAPDDPAGVPSTIHGARVETVPSWALPSYPQVRVAHRSGRHRLAQLIAEHRPDVVHLASPFVLGWHGTLAARAAGVPTVAVYQTDVPGFARGYHLARTERALWKRVRDIHTTATLTLAPSSASQEGLAAHGVDNIRRWGRGVDCVRFDPRHRDEDLRRQLAPSGERLVGFVGRVAPEKQVRDLIALADLPGTRLVVVGDGPDRAQLQRDLPGAHFTGMLHGADLARTMASLDVLVAPGESETFCQVVQESMASGVPVVAPAAGGPRDLVDESRTGWLYAPGDLVDMRDRVRDLAGDPAKRDAFGAAARAAVLPRSWTSVMTQLVGHYDAAIALHAPTPVRSS